MNCVNVYRINYCSKGRRFLQTENRKLLKYFLSCLVSTNIHISFILRNTGLRVCTSFLESSKNNLRILTPYYLSLMLKNSRAMLPSAPRVFLSKLYYYNFDSKYHIMATFDLGNMNYDDYEKYKCS